MEIKHLKITTTEILFTYGTLMRPDLITRITTNTRLQAEPATLNHFQRRSLRQRHYPGLINKTGSKTRGIVYRGLSTDDLTELDLYEGGEYERIRVLVQTGTGRCQAWCYLLRPEYHHLIVNQDWTE